MQLKTHKLTNANSLANSALKVKIEVILEEL